MQQRVQIFHRRPKRSSSAVQLPITATLHAEHLTLFATIIHHLAANVNREMYQYIEIDTSPRFHRFGRRETADDRLSAFLRPDISK